MFHTITPEMQAQMQRLEEMDARDRSDGTPRMQRLRQVPPETGKFLAILAASAPAGKVVEIGTSAGYSTLWLALTGRQVITFEALSEKVRLARQTFREAGVEGQIELIGGDARRHLPGLEGIAFCFLDAEKEVYLDCYELVVPNLIPGGLITADNTINHRATLQPMIDRALSDPRLDAVEVPIGNGVLVGRAYARR